MVKNPVKVCIRTRPTANYAQKELQIDQEANTITVDAGSGPHEDGTPYNRQDNYKFKYHQILHNASQETVYARLTSDVVQQVMDGVNGTIMSYGQTGAGKTFTMIGDTRNYQHRGIAPRAIAQVFSEVDSRIETEFKVRVSYMEIYNERIFDLLDDQSNTEQKETLQIVDDKKGGKGVYVRGITMKDVPTEGDALNELFNGELGRTTAEHKLNKRSNRSHCIFTIYVSQRSRTGVSERVIHSKLHLVDLAGSERLKKTMDDSDGVEIDETIKKESMYINQSLTYLEQCVVALSKKSSAHVPYRQTKLTNVLKDSLGGNCNTLMFACIWGESKHLEETISTLRLAQRMMRVQNETNQNVEMDPLILVRKYEKQIKELKQELMMHDALSERTISQGYDEYTPEQRVELKSTVRRYVDASPDEEDTILQVESMRQMNEIFRQFKSLVKEKEATLVETRNMISRGGGRTSAGTDGQDGGGLGDTTKAMADLLQDESSRIGEVEKGAGFGVGQGDDSARPSSIDSSARQKEEIVDDATSVGIASPLAAKHATFGDFDDEEPPPLDRNEAYTLYKRQQGAPLNKALADIQVPLREVKKKTKAMMKQLNDLKNTIDRNKELLDQKSAQRKIEMDGVEGGENIVDEEEFAMMVKLKDMKKRYKDMHGEYKGDIAKKESLRKEETSAKQALIDSFNQWYASARPTTGMGGPESEEQDEADVLDDGEQFEQLEITRVMNQDPDSLAFFQAQKKMRSTANHDRTSNMRKQKLKRNQ